MITNPYSYFFYRTYEWKLRHEEKSLSLFVALMMTAIVLTHNLFITAALTEWVLAIDFLPMARSQIMAVGIALTAVISALLYFYWIGCGRYELILSKYSIESLKERRLRTILMVTHIGVTFASNIVVPILIHESMVSGT